MPLGSGFGVPPVKRQHIPELFGDRPHKVKGMLIKTVKRLENVITRQFEILEMLKQDSFDYKNYGIIRA